MTLDDSYFAWSEERTEQSLNMLMTSTKVAVERQLRGSTSLADLDNFDDSVQKTLTYLWERLDQFEPNPEIEDSFSRWVSAVTKFAGLGTRRDRIRFERKHKVFADIGSADDLRDDEESPDLNELPDDLCELVRWAQLGYSAEESAERMGVSYSALRKRLQRFRDARVTARAPRNRV